MHRKGFCTLNRSVFTVVYENARYLPWFSKTLDIYRGFRKHAVFQVCKTIFARYLSTFWNIHGKLPPKKVVTWKRFLYVRPLFARYLPQTSIHTFVCNNSFLTFLDCFSLFHRRGPCFLTLGGPKKVSFWTLCAFRCVSMYVCFAP